MRIAIDFDGTIVDHEYPEIGKLKEGAVEAIKKLVENGHEIIIWSCRSSTDSSHPLWPDRDRVFTEMMVFLDFHGVPYTYIDDGSHGKVTADVYLDDKAMMFVNWSDALRRIEVRGNAAS